MLKKELNQFYRSPSGWLFDAVLLFFVGLYTVIVNFNLAYPNFEYTLNNAAFIYIFLIPVLTMRAFAEERKQRTDKLLYALPLKMSEIVIGKYLALAVVLLIPTPVMLLYPLFLKSLGAGSLAAAYASILGFFLLGAALASIGMFISTLTESLAISAGGCFAALLLIYFAPDLADYMPTAAGASFAALCILLLLAVLLVWLLVRSTVFTLILAIIGALPLEFSYLKNPQGFVSLLPNVLRHLALFRRFYEFANGILDLGTILYFLSVIVLFLCLSVQSAERRRWS